MRTVEYWPRANKLVYLDEQATPEFWDALWEKEGRPPPLAAGDMLNIVTPKFLASGAKVLEGGCGRGDKVNALCELGYKASGIDFADDTVQLARSFYPHIDVKKGDVRKLDFDAATFDGYWSIGVIEHFWGGYSNILAEAARILRPGGVLFLTVPWFSPYRQRCARAGRYPIRDFDSEPSEFFQFALGSSEIIASLEDHGFQVKRVSGLSPELSIREDFISFRGPIDWLFGSRGSFVKRVVRRGILSLLNNYCGHSVLIVAKKQQGAN